MFSGEVSPHGTVGLESCRTSINATSERKVWITGMGIERMPNILLPRMTTKRTVLAMVRLHSNMHGIYYYFEETARAQILHDRAIAHAHM